jgi:hypothetical protein
MRTLNQGLEHEEYLALLEHAHDLGQTPQQVVREWIAPRLNELVRRRRRERARAEND